MKILFQGDSITDAGRDKRNYHDMGPGYPKYAAELIEAEFPNEEFEFINLGVAGCRTGQLADKLYSDAIAFQPDIVSVLIGINDIWYRYAAGKIETSDEQIQENYRTILKRLRCQTNAKIIIMAPYLLEREGAEHIREDLYRIIQIVKELSDEYADAYIPLNEYFEEALKEQPEPNYYSADGIHPNDNGARFIGKLYFETACQLIKNNSKAN